MDRLLADGQTRGFELAERKQGCPLLFFCPEEGLKEPSIFPKTGISRKFVLNAEEMVGKKMNAAIPEKIAQPV
ncbi:hypothetical protein [Caldibacillus debilis]|jgi:hypothetical protein|uniref:Uncharacterized protein n=1 Tax=Caldibacillus debilis TaxID=301148 RepID=A0A150LAH2_9BACI|nr:hypothetical protein [Caldibacillus debilis]KYD09009.1 hypothetical protein B4135_3920 [Caldibacillus debilis]